MKVTPSGFDSKKISWLLEQDLEVKLIAMQHHLHIVRMLINDILEDEVKQYSGIRYSHTKPHEGRYSRWGSNPGSVKIGGQRLRIRIPRLFDKLKQRNKTLQSYEKLRELQGVDDRIFKAILLGLSTRNYDQVVGNLMDSFGFSASSVSREFIEKSKQRLYEFENRDLSSYEFVALFIDGKSLAKEQIIIALGVTLTGEKIPLGFIQSSTENARSIKEMLSTIISRGFVYDQGLLCVIDGAKGIYKAVKETFEKHVVIQRCQWHKRENVLSYLPENKQEHYKRRINKAYNQETYEEAKSSLKTIIQDLKTDNLSAARSLEEGLEETLTLHRLGLTEYFQKSFSTTNVIENLNSQIEKYLRNVKYWKTSEQRYRWVGSALLEIERRMRRVKNYKKLHLMKHKLKEEVQKQLEIIRGVA